MSIALQVVDAGPIGRKRFIKYKATMSNNYVTGGDVADLTLATSPSFLLMAFPTVSYVPTAKDVNFQDSASGYMPEWVDGTTNANGKIQFNSSGGNEVPQAAYPAALAADEVFFSIQIPLGK